ncbi:MAG TPA: CDP-alcohol phosphatidyltransferase family protein [Bacteroidia bacterium]
MKNFKNNIPELLIYSRLVIAWIILTLGIAKPKGVESAICTLLVIGLVTDIFDGIIARYLHISTTHLRQLDTKIDRLFWITALFVTLFLHPLFLFQHWLGLSILLVTELMTWLIGKVKFKNNISFHSILSKFWAISILITLIDVILDGHADITFAVTFWYGLIVQLDILLITLILPEFQCDIPSTWHAIRIRKGKTIGRLKIFNG